MMFTGIITHVGKLKEKNGSVFTFTVPSDFIAPIKSGGSIAINGVCLTVVEKPRKNAFAVELMPETKRQTTFGGLNVNNLVNLELPATPQTLLSGHIVQGHIDDLGKIVGIKNDGNSRLIIITLPPSLTRYIVEKGSIAVNGVSLVVIDVTTNTFSVGIIPYTWKHTMFNTLKTHDRVNLEVDILAKYVKRLLKASRKPRRGGDVLQRRIRLWRKLKL